MMTLAAVLRFRQVFGAVWSECMPGTSPKPGASPTKFIVSDHPVRSTTASARHSIANVSGPATQTSRLNGTHTIFPLSMEKVLILTNKSWATNPYTPPTKMRPDPSVRAPARSSTKWTFTGRELTEDEVLRINLIIKDRAYRFIGAAKKDWL